MNMILPKKLATTMGYELTYMPRMLDDVYILTKGQVKGWNDSVSNINGFLRIALRDVMRITRPNDYNLYAGWSLDPSVVEVQTQPQQSSRKLMRAVKSCNEIAEQVGLMPRAIWTRGGGAHLHTGIPYDPCAERMKYLRYCGVMQYITFHNPWLAWAFANPLDEENAKQLTHDIEPPQRGRACPLHTNSLTTRTYLNYVQEFAAMQKRIVMLTKQLHHADTWHSTRLRNYKESAIRDELQSLCYFRKRMKRAEVNMLREMEEDWNEACKPKPEAHLVPLHDAEQMHISESKYVCVARREKGHYGTFEFRMFMMYEHHSEHKKQIALANELVRRAKDAVEWNKDMLVKRSVAPKLLRDMKYSDAKNAFHNMLRELDMDPADFREETVNIALRKRAICYNRVSI